jgi:hypothetical protein
MPADALLQAKGDRVDTDRLLSSSLKTLKRMEVGQLLLLLLLLLQ